MAVLSMDLVWRKSRQCWRRLSYLPTLLLAEPVPSLAIVTGSDESHFRSLRQFVASARAHEGAARLIVYDLGISGDHLSQLAGEFPGIVIRRFPFERYPGFLNIRVNAGQYAWKPVIINEVLDETMQPMVWMDAGNLILRPLNAVRRILNAVGFYSPHSKGSICQWTHPGMLRYLQVDHSLYRRQNLNGACVAFNPARPDCLALARRWRDLALVRECIAPDGSDRTNHRQDQALLTVLAYQAGLGQVSYPSFAGYDIHRDVEAGADPKTVQRMQSTPAFVP